VDRTGTGFRAYPKSTSGTSSACRKQPRASVLETVEYTERLLRRFKGANVKSDDLPDDSVPGPRVDVLRESG